MPPACRTTTGTTAFLLTDAVDGVTAKEPWADLPEALPRPLEQFIDAVAHGKRDHLVSVREAAYSSYVMEMISSAAAERRWMPINPTALKWRQRGANALRRPRSAGGQEGFGDLGCFGAGRDALFGEDGVDFLAFVGGQAPLDGRDGFFQFLAAADADQGHCDRGVAEDPGDGELGDRLAVAAAIGRSRWTTRSCFGNCSRWNRGRPKA